MQRALPSCPAIRVYYERLTHGRADRRKKAIIAAARKLLTVCYAMLRDGTQFNPRQFAGLAV